MTLARRPPVPRAPRQPDPVRERYSLAASRKTAADIGRSPQVPVPATPEDNPMPMPLLRAAALAAAVIAAVPQLARADVMHVTTRQGAREAIVLQSSRTPAPTVIVLHGATIT